MTPSLRHAGPPAAVLAAVLLAACSGSEPAAQPVAATATPASDATAPAPVTDLEPIDADTTPDPFAVTSLAPDGKPSPPSPADPRTPDVVFVPTPQEVVDEMLRMVDVGPDDVLYDLGSGDGRIPITAARNWGTRGVGIDIDPARIREANAAAEAAGVTDKVTFIEGDMFEADLSDATVVSLYLLPSLNLRLRPTLLDLKPGTRIVTHNYHMGDWEPEQRAEVGNAVVYAWTVPEGVPAHLRADDD